MESDEEQSNGEGTPPISDGPFSLELPDYGQTLRFDGLAEFQKWAENEHSFWRKVPKLEQVTRLNIKEPLNEHRKFFKDLSVNARDWRDNEDKVRREAAKMETIMAVETLQRGEILPLTGLRGRRFQQLLDDNPLTAAGMLLWIYTDSISATRFSEPQITQALLVRAMTEARVSELEGKGELDAVKSQLEELANEWDDRAKAHVKILSETEAAALAIHDNAATAFDAISGMRDDHENEMTRIRQNYDNFLVLEESADYWLKKKKDHSVVARNAFAAFTLGVAFGIEVIWLQGVSIIDMLKDDAGTIGFGSVVLITLPGLAYFWFLRLISRIFVTNLHLMADAELRATMVSTFHALMNDDTNPVSSDERLLVLQALFRPAGEGGDDAAPTNLMEKIISGRATSSG